MVLTLYPDLGKVGAYVPTFDRWMEGHSVEESLDKARELISICNEFASEDGTELPATRTLGMVHAPGGGMGRGCGISVSMAPTRIGDATVLV